MGQKVSPKGFRLVTRKIWESQWFANKKEFGDLLAQDRLIRKYLKSKSFCVGSSKIVIKRMSGKIEIVIHTSRPGLVIGKRGADVDLLKKELKELTGSEVWIEVEEIKRPDLDAKLVAESMAKQLIRRMPYKRIMKKALQASMDAGAAGIKIQVSGRLGGAEIARAEWYKKGTVPLHTLRANIDYAGARAETTYGALGVKVWIHKGEEVVA